jgi:membrane-associated phospholipid phosphatase
MKQEKPIDLEKENIEDISTETAKQAADRSNSALVGLSGSALLLAVFGALTASAAKRKPMAIDRTFDDWLKDNNGNGLEKYFRSFTLLGKEPVTLGLAGAAFGFLQQRKQPVAAWLVLISTWVGWLLSRPVKVLVKRPRPFSINTLAHHPNATSYPSGHSVAAICFYGILTWLGLKFFKGKLTRFGWAVLMVYLILMIGFSRAYLKEHYLSDVLGGYLLGSFWLTVVVCTANLYHVRPEV